MNNISDSSLISNNTNTTGTPDHPLMTLLKRKTLPYSALSDVVFTNNQLYFVADNINALLVSDIDCAAWHSYPLDNIPYSLESIPKPEKIDFEAMCLIKDLENKPMLFAMASGSLAPRQCVLLIDPTTYHTTALKGLSDYLHFHTPSFTNQSDVNIEACCAVNDELYVFQRGNVNQFHGVHVFNTKNLLKTQNWSQSYLRSFTVDLPPHYSAGISAVSYLEKERLFFMCASQEATTSAYDDGDIMGSVWGLTTLDGKSLYWHRIRNKENEVLKIKIEGCTVLEQSKNPYKLFMVTDQDTSPSEGLWTELTLPNSLKYF